MTWISPGGSFGISLGCYKQRLEALANELLALCDEVLKPVHLPQVTVRWNQMPFKVFAALIEEPLFRQGIPLATRAIFFSAQDRGP